MVIEDVDRHFEEISSETSYHRGYKLYHSKSVAQNDSYNSDYKKINVLYLQCAKCMKIFLWSMYMFVQYVPMLRYYFL